MTRILLAAGASNVGASNAKLYRLDPISPARVPSVWSWNTESWPPELYSPTLGAGVALGLGEEDLCLRHHYSSSSLAEDWWPNGGPGTPANQFVSIVQTALASLDSYTIEGMVWFQGSGDTHEQAHADAYEGNLDILPWFASEIGVPDLKVALVHTLGIGGEYQAEVAAAQARYATAHDGVELVRGYGSMRRIYDEVHLGGWSDSMFSMGLACGTVLKAMAGGPP